MMMCAETETDLVINLDYGGGQQCNFVILLERRMKQNLSDLQQNKVLFEILARDLCSSDCKKGQIKIPIIHHM